MLVPQALWGHEWERRRLRNRVHLTFTGCLGPCAVGNNALLMLYGRSIWLKDLNRPDLAIAVHDWIEKMLADNHIIPPPDEPKITFMIASCRRHQAVTSPL